MHKAVFLDKDGTLIRDVPYNVDPAKIRLYPDVPEALQLLQQHGYRLVVISNQSGVARGYFEEPALTGVRDELSAQVGKYGVTLDGFYYCPHHPQGTVAAYTMDCLCRKPKPGLLLRAAQELTIDLTCSWMIGDTPSDVEAGETAGCRSILISSGNKTKWEITENRMLHGVAGNLREAAIQLLDYEKLLRRHGS